MEPVKLALVSATIHHLVIQYPSQSGIFTTLYSFALFNAVFMVLNGFTNSPFVEVGSKILGLFIFNSVFVFPSKVISDTFKVTHAFILKIVYNVYFRHRGIPGTFWYCASDWTLWKQINYANPNSELEKLHAELGTSKRGLYLTKQAMSSASNQIIFLSIQSVHLKTFTVKIQKLKEMNFTPRSAREPARHQYLRKRI
jgi:hypothetical protein